MRSSGSAIAVCSIALFASLAANGQELTPEELLRRMSVSLRRVDFEGSFIYQHDGRTDALRIFHEGGEQERERLVSLSGARGEIVRAGHSVTCLQSNTSPTLFANRAEMRLLPLVPNVRELGAQYSVSLAGVDRVAGYDARIVDVVPRDPYRYGYRLWLQQGNQLPLRSAIVDEARRPLEQFMFVALEIGEKPSETDLAATGNLASAASPVDEVPVTTKPFWNITDAPAGFHLIRTQRPLGPASRSEHLIYTDGIASVSVYVEPQAQAAPGAAESTIVHGAVSIHSLDSGGVHVTALGDVPPATVQAMARSVRASATE